MANQVRIRSKVEQTVSTVLNRTNQYCSFLLTLTVPLSVHNTSTGLYAKVCWQNTVVSHWTRFSNGEHGCWNGLVGRRLEYSGVTA